MTKILTEYDHPEYQKRQAELAGKGFLLDKLETVYHGLETPLSSHEEGLLSFEKLLGLDHVESYPLRSFFIGKTVFEALTHDDVVEEHLMLLKDYGKLLITFGNEIMSGNLRVRKPIMGHAHNLQIVGYIIYNIAVAQGLLLFDSDISTIPRNERLPLFEDLSERPYLVDSVKQILEQGILYINEEHNPNGAKN